MKTRLDEMTWPEVKETLAKANLVIIPIGSTEEHGKHLPLNVDSLCATRFAEEAARQVMGRGDWRVLVAPTIDYSDVSVHRSFPGTVGIKAETLVLVLKDLVDAFLKQGFPRIILFSSHRENDAPMEMALRALADCHPAAKLLALTSLGLGFDARASLVKAGDAGEGHALEIETSLSLLLQPENVHMDQAQKGERILPISPRYIGNSGSDRSKGVIYYNGTRGFERSGTYGDPTLASRSEGESIFQAIAADLADIIEQVLKLD